MAIEQLTYVQAITIGALQGVTELFPVSSLGHSVLIPAWIGGSWAALVTQESSSESPYLAFLVGLHVATALALLWYFRAEWVRIVRGFVRSLRQRRISRRRRQDRLAGRPRHRAGGHDRPARRAHAAHSVRQTVYASVFLALNGLILLAGERYRRRADQRVDAAVARPPAVSAAGHGGRGRAGEAPTRVGELGPREADGTKSPPRSRDAATSGDAR